MKWQIPYQGRTWVFDDSRLNGGEARIQKRLTGGLTPSAASAARYELDIDAFAAALAIARRRAGLPAEEAVAIDVEDILLMGGSDAVAEATEAAAKAAHVPAVEAAAVVEGEVVDEPAPKRARKTAS